MFTGKNMGGSVFVSYMIKGLQFVCLSLVRARKIRHLTHLFKK